MLSLVSSKVQASDNLPVINDIQTGISVCYGKVLAHHSSISDVVTNNIAGFEVNMLTRTYGRSAWDKLYRFPELGLGYFFSTLGNDDILGQAHTVHFFTRIKITPAENKLYANYELSLGSAWLTRKFDSIENSLNPAISSHLNLFARIKFTLGYRINAKSTLNASLSFAHYSNGKVKTPNLGINTSFLSVDYIHSLRQEIADPDIESITVNIKKHTYELFLSTGKKSDDQASARLYWIGSLVGDYSFAPWYKYALGTGIDFFYDQALGPNKVAEEGGSYNQSDLFQAGIHASLYARYDRLRLVAQLGTYIYAGYFKYSRIYSRIGLRYHISKKIQLNLTMKSHQTIADFLEWGIGYQFGK